MKTKLIGGKIITPQRILTDSVLLLREGKIEYIGKDIAAPDYEVIDCGGNYLSPGFIDIHTHGAGGYDFMDATKQAMDTASLTYARHGATSVLATGVASDLLQLEKLFSAFREAKNNTPGANLVGIHLEGPYYAHDYRGAQEAKHLRNPDPSEYESVLALTEDLKIWSVAPELPGALALGRTLERQGIIAAIGHSGATFDETLAAIEHGYSLVTHLYSCTSGVVRKNSFRIAGIIEAAYYHDGLTVEMIADGAHLPPALLRLIHKLKGADHAILVSDSIRATGLGDGDYLLGSLTEGQDIEVREGVAFLKDGSGFAGGVGTADRLVRNMVQLADVPLVEAVRMMTATPAALLNLTEKGKIALGADADLILFDENIMVQSVMIGGRFLSL